jgi:hypothetical protein
MPHPNQQRNKRPPTEKQLAALAKGRKLWKPGESGNPAGLSKPQAEVMRLAREAGPKAMQTLIDLLDDEDPKVRQSSAIALLDRGFGRPKQTVEGSVDISITQLHLDAVRELAAVQRRSSEWPAQERPGMIDGNATVIDVDEGEVVSPSPERGEALKLAYAQRARNETPIPRE